MIFWIIFKVTIRLLLKVPEFTTEHQKWPKLSKNSMKHPFFARGAKKSPLPEIEISPCSGIYLLVIS